MYDMLTIFVKQQSHTNTHTVNFYPIYKMTIVCDIYGLPICDIYGLPICDIYGLPICDIHSLPIWMLLKYSIILIY